MISPRFAIVLGALIFWSLTVERGPDPAELLSANTSKTAHRIGLQNPRASDVIQELGLLTVGELRAIADVPCDDTGDLSIVCPSPRKKPDQAHFINLTYQRCLDANTCEFTLPVPSELLGEHVVVKLDGIQTPNMRGKCEQEKILANDARDLLHFYLSEASRVELYDHYQVGFEVVGRLVADGQDLSDLLIGQGLAAPYGAEKKDWCL